MLEADSGLEDFRSTARGKLPSRSDADADGDPGLEAADLGSVPSDSTSERPIPDAFGYRVSYGGDTVITDSAAMPKKLRALMVRLGELVDRYAK